MRQPGHDGDTTQSINNEPVAAAVDNDEDEPLSTADLEAFIRDGYVLLKRAFDPSVAAACRDEIWRVMEEETRTTTRTRMTCQSDADGSGKAMTATHMPVPAPSKASPAPQQPPPSSSGTSTSISRHDPSTWPVKFPLARIYRPEDGPPWSDVFTPRLCKAVDQLCGGRGSWESFGCGWWMITFPGSRGTGGEEGEREEEEEEEGSSSSSIDYSTSSSSSPSSSSTTITNNDKATTPSSSPSTPSSSSSSSVISPPPPWQLDGHWHIDGQTRHRCLHSQQVGLVPIFLFSTIKPGGGGTALCQGSHKYIARLLKEAGPEGMDAVEVIKKGQAWVEEGREGGRVMETVGEAGDVMFTHPFLLHGRSANCAVVPKEGEGGREEGVRFMCHPSVSLTRVPWVGGRGGGREGGMSVIERAIVAGWEGKEGGREVFAHEECLAAVAAATSRWKGGRGVHSTKRRRAFREGREEEEEEEEEEVEVLPEGVDADVMAVMGMTGFGSGGGKRRRR